MLNFAKYLQLNEKYTEEDIIDIIKSNGKVYSDSVYNNPNHNSDKPMQPIEVSDDIVMVNINGDIYQIDLENITKIEREI